jgi:hypothetical protein
MPHEERLRAAPPEARRRWARRAALLSAAVVIGALFVSGTLVGWQRLVLRRLPAPQVPAGYRTTPVAVPAEWTRWCAQDNADWEVYAKAWAWLHGSSPEPTVVADYLASDAEHRRELYVGLSKPLSWSSLQSSHDDGPPRLLVEDPATCGGTLLVRWAAENLQLAAAADPRPTAELRSLDTLSQAMWPPVDLIWQDEDMNIATIRDQAYLLAIAQGRLPPEATAGWLREPARAETGLIDAEQVETQYWEPLWARWAVQSGPLAYHSRWPGAPAWPQDLWGWVQFPAAATKEIGIDRDLIKRLSGEGPPFPFFDLSAFRGGPLRDTDLAAYQAERAVIADAMHRARRLAADVLLHWRATGGVPTQLHPTIDYVELQPAGQVELQLLYDSETGRDFVIWPTRQKAPEFITPRYLNGQLAATTAAVPIQELQCGLRVDCAALGR